MLTYFPLLGALSIGCCIGYLYGLSLIRQGRALPPFSLLPFIRIPAVALIAYYLLHWGTIAFILFVGSFLATVWALLLLSNTTKP